MYESGLSLLTIVSDTADCVCINSHCLIPRFSCGPFLTGISQVDISEKGWGETEREKERERGWGGEGLKTEGPIINVWMKRHMT